MARSIVFFRHRPGRAERLQTGIALHRGGKINLRVRNGISLAVNHFHHREAQALTVAGKQGFIRGDAVSGVQVFSETLPWEKMDDLSCYEDRKGNLFIGILEDAENGYWISTDTWLPMALVPDMMLYNKYCDRILEHTHDISKNVYQVNAIRLPTTEEVIELVRGILN